MQWDGQILEDVDHINLATSTQKVKNPFLQTGIGVHHRWLFIIKYRGVMIQHDTKNRHGEKLGEKYWITSNMVYADGPFSAAIGKRSRSQSEWRLVLSTQC